MKNRYNIRAAVRVALTVGLAATVSVPAAALAQDSQSPRSPAKLGKVEVTGTRIKRTSLETSQTIVRLNRKQLDATGLTSVGQILRKVSSAGTPTNGGYSEGGTGEQRVDLRYLGSKRVLVLVDGHRWVQNNNAAGTGIGLTLGLQGAVDVGTIPFSIVDHIEILENGASALYGSDAIAGVVNIITKKDFHGITATAYYSGYKAPGEAFDGQRQHYSATLGTSSSDQKSNLLFNVSYVKQNPILARNRDISKYPINYPNRKIASHSISSAALAA